jgi:hypothetical protein
MRPLPGSGEIADRVRFLAAVRQEAPQVLQDLRHLLTPEIAEMFASLRAHTSLVFRASATLGPFVLSPSHVRPLRDFRAHLAAIDAGRRAEVPLLPVTGSKEIAQLNAELRAWATRWRLAGIEKGSRLRGAWLLCVAAKTLADWSRSPGVSDERRTLDWFKGPLDFKRRSVDAWGDVRLLFIETTAAPPTFEATSARRSREKGPLGVTGVEGPGSGSVPVEVLSVAEQWRLIALARWQVLGEGVVRLRTKWPGYRPWKSWSVEEKTGRRRRNPSGAKHADSAIAQAMESLGQELDLPLRPRSRAGRPRRIG